MDTTKDAYKAKMEAQLKLWSARLGIFKAKANKANADAKVELLKQTDELKAFEEAAQKHLADVESAAAETWQRVKGSFEQKWNQLSGSVEAVWEKISPSSTTKN